MKKIVLLFFVSVMGCAPVSYDLQFEKIADGLKFPEGPAWDGKGTLYVSNCYGDWITQIKGGVADTFVTSPTLPDSFSKTNGLTVYKNGRIYACDYGRGAILSFSEDGTCNTLISGYQGKKFNRPNDLAFDEKGRLYFTDPKSYDPKNPDGVIYVYLPDLKIVKPAYRGLCFPNGLAFSLDNQFLYVCESAKQRVLKFSVSEDGLLSDPLEFAQLPGGDPDGIGLDEQGNVYVAHFGAAAIHIFKADGSLIKKVATPGKKPSNVEFGGADYKTLFITEDETNAVYRTTVPIAGHPLF